MYIDSSKMTGQSSNYSISTLPEQNANTATLPMTESEQRQSAAWNATRQDNPQDTCIPQLVAERATTAPDAVYLDTGMPILTQQRVADPSSVATLDDLVSVIYTSGSISHPKGEQITHSNLLNLVFWHRHAFAITSVVATSGHAPPTAHSTGSPNIGRPIANTQIYILDMVQIKVTGYA